MALNPMTAWIYAMQGYGNPDDPLYYGDSPSPEMTAYANAAAGDREAQSAVRAKMLDLLANPETVTAEQEQMMLNRSADSLNMGQNAGTQRMQELAAASGGNAGAGGFRSAFNEMLMQNLQQRQAAHTDIRLGVADLNRNARSNAVGLVGNWQNQRDAARSGMAAQYAGNYQNFKQQEKLQGDALDASKSGQVLGTLAGGIGTLAGLPWGSLGSLFSGGASAAGAGTSGLSIDDLGTGLSGVKLSNLGGW